MSTRCAVKILFGLFCVTIFMAVSQSASAKVAPPPFDILWAGDTMLGDASQDMLEQHGYAWPFEYLLPNLGADYMVINLEAPITTDVEPWDTERSWSYNVQPESAHALAKIGVNAVSLANNHSLDRGPEGLSDTLKHLDTAGIEAFGAGKNLQNASMPLIIETPHGRVGVIGLTYPQDEKYQANEKNPGVVMLSEATITRGYELAHLAGADKVVAFVHWGSNYSNVTNNQLRWGWLFARAGYDLVIGHHAHHEQPIAIIDGMPVLFSIGNFAFGSPGRFNEDFPGFGLMVNSTVGPSGFDELAIRCIQTDNDNVEFQPRPCSTEQATRVLGALHRDIVIREGVGVLRW